MYYYLVCPIGVIGGKEDYLTYQYAQLLEVGVLVTIPFGMRVKQGIVVQVVNQPRFDTKTITKDLQIRLPLGILELAKWMSSYYVTRLSIVLQTILPAGLGTKRRSINIETHFNQRSTTKIIPTSEQANALADITKSTAITHLLHGVTGSGKTWLYQELTKQSIAAGKSSLILVPEIALTPQLASEFQHLHSNVAILHSGLSPAKRHLLWQKIQASKEPWILVGPRSTLFSPLRSIGIIIIDECHEPSYHQDNPPKYSALRVARKLAGLHPGAKLILGSATPNLQDYFIAKTTGAPVIELTTSVHSVKPTISIVDMRDSQQFGTHPLFSRALLEAMDKTIASGKQLLLFHNRRGTARLGLCSSCGWVAECPTCHIPFKLHHDTAQFRCHVCDRQQPLPHSCPVCNSTSIDFKGFGSKRIEQEVRRRYPQINVARFDSDTPIAEQIQARYQDLYDNKIQIIIGTQTVAKGLDLPQLNTVGVVQADSELFIPDFSSAERSFQLITQVIGRAGRNGQDSTVIIQTLNPDHPIIIAASQQDYQAFYRYEIAERQAEHVMPFSFMLHLKVGYSKATTAKNAGQKLYTQIKRDHPQVTLRGPSPAFHEHRGQQYYWQLVVLSQSRTTLTQIAHNLPSRWTFCLDPVNLL